MLMIVFFGSPESIAKSPEQTRAAFRSVAAKMQFFLWDAFLYRIRPAGPSPSRIDEYMKLLDVICDKGNDRQTVIELLRDTNPQVRTLALASLFDREEPSLLPYFVPLCKDGAQTFKTYGYDMSQAPRDIVEHGEPDRLMKSSTFRLRTIVWNCCISLGTEAPPR
jgi:hypothetical protein